MMRRVFGWLTLACVVNGILAACVTTGNSPAPLTPAQQAEILCASIGTALSSLPSSGSPLNDAAKSTIDAALAAAAPICLNPNPPANITQLQTQALAGALASLQVLAKSNPNGVPAK